MRVLFCCFSKNAVMHDGATNSELDKRITRVKFNTHVHLRFIEGAGLVHNVTVPLKSGKKLVKQFCKSMKIGDNSSFRNLNVNDFIDAVNSEILSRAIREFKIPKEKREEFKEILFNLSSGILIDLLNSNTVFSLEDLKEKWLEKAGKWEVKTRVAETIDEIFSEENLGERSFLDANDAVLYVSEVAKAGGEEDSVEVKILYEVLHHFDFSRKDESMDLREALKNLLPSSYGIKELWSETEKELKVLILIEELFEKDTEFRNDLKNWIEVNRTPS